MIHTVLDLFFDVPFFLSSSYLIILHPFFHIVPYMYSTGVYFSHSGPPYLLLGLGCRLDLRSPTISAGKLSSRSP